MDGASWKWGQSANKKSWSPAGTSTPRGWQRVSPKMTWSQTSPPCTREPPTGENKYTMAFKERQIRRYKDKCHVIPEGQIRNLNGIETNLPEEGWIRYSILCISEPPEFEKRKNLSSKLIYLSAWFVRAEMGHSLEFSNGELILVRWTWYIKLLDFKHYFY